MNYIKLNPTINELIRLNEFIHENSIQDYDVDLIIEEIFVNIVKYSKCSYIIVKIEMENHIIKIEFIDNGFEFNPLKNDLHSFPDNVDEAKIGGLGIHLVKSLADELNYEYKNDENHLTILKK